jgi:hypothetical protein
LKLIDLNPKWDQNIPLADGIFTGLIYKCPVTRRMHTVDFFPIIDPYGVSKELLERIKVGRIGRLVWQRIGDTFETITLTPSISRSCCHVTISNGMVLLH